MKNNTNYPQSLDCIDLAIAELSQSLSLLDKQAFVEFLAFQYVKMLQNSEGWSFDEAIWQSLGEFLASQQEGPEEKLFKLVKIAVVQRPC